MKIEIIKDQKPLNDEDITDELLEIFKSEILKYPDESVRECWNLAKGWYELRDFKNDPIDFPIEL